MERPRQPGSHRGWRRGPLDGPRPLACASPARAGGQAPERRCAVGRAGRGQRGAAEPLVLRQDRRHDGDRPVASLGGAQAGQDALEERRGDPSGPEVLVGDDALEDGNGRPHPGHLVLRQGPGHARERGGAIDAPHDQLAHQRVVVAGHGEALVDAGVVAHPRPAPERAAR